MITAPRARRDVGFHLTLSQADRELLDRMAAAQGCSRTTLIARSLHLLDCAQARQARGETPLATAVAS